jgi:hypothetical protein
MNTNTRKICQFCRYKSCLAIGMKPKWVLSDDERHQKYGNRRKNKLRPEDTAPVAQLSTQQSSSAPFTPTDKSVSNNNSTHDLASIANATAQLDSTVMTPQSGKRSDSLNDSTVNIKSEPSSSNNQTNASNSDDEESECSPEPGAPTHTQSDIKRLGVDGVNTNVITYRNGSQKRTNRYLTLNSYEKDLIDRLSIAFYHSRKYNALDLNIQKKLAALFQTANPGSLKKMSKVILANFIVQPVKRVITFAKLIPDFLKLELNDQMCLLQGGSMEIFICSSSSLYDQMSNKISNIVSKDRNIQGADSSNIQLDILRLIWSEDVFEKTIGFLKFMSELKLDEATLILFMPLILFSPDRRNLQNRSQVCDIQSKYSLLLKKYMLWKYGHKAETLRLYDKLLLKLIELRTLHEMHSSILLDADPSQLDPFPLAIILNEMDPAPKPKVTVAETATASSERATEQQEDQVSQSVSSDENRQESGSSAAAATTIAVTEPKSISNGIDNNLSVLTPASFSSSSGQISSVSSDSSPVSLQSQQLSPTNETHMLTEATHKMDLVE